MYPPPGGFSGSNDLTVTVSAASDPSNKLDIDTTDSNDPLYNLTFETEDDIELEFVNGSTTNTTAVTIAQDGDIILDFNKAFDLSNATPPAPLASAALYFTHTSSGYSTQTVAGVAIGDRSLKITPTSLLALPAAGVTYQVRYEATSDGVKTAGVITVTVNNGSGFTPTKSAASFGGLAASGAPYANSVSTISLAYTPAAAPPFTQTYTITRIAYTTPWESATTVGSGYAVPKGSTANTALAPVVGLAIIGDTPHSDAENIRFRLEGVNANGYVANSTPVSITFTP
jgi:hypothetical protein